MIKYLPEVARPQLDQLLRHWKERHPGLAVCVYLPEANSQHIPEIQQCCRHLGVPVVGAVFPSLISDGEFQASGMLVFGFVQRPMWLLSDKAATTPESVELLAHQLAVQLEDGLADRVEATLFMIFDAMVPNIATILDAIYLRLANRVHYAGANAGSETFEPMPCLFDDQRVLQNGFLLMLLKPHRGAILEHGYHAPGMSVYATSVEGNKIGQIDWKPAFGAYKELVAKQFDVAITTENFYQLAVHYPFGILRANHHALVRIPVRFTSDGSLFCVGEIPPNSVLTLMAMPLVDSHETLDRIEDGLTEIGVELAHTELQLFYCAGRRLHMGTDRAAQEVKAFAERFPGHRISGAVSLGEIGSSTVGGYPLFHNATLVAMPWWRISQSS